ncbi:MAG: hypothetical protein QF717_16535, partial [SAR202 cluster bacterium]|nr:hypothetical protein [SAR202 cluster bacterium]
MAKVMPTPSTVANATTDIVAIAIRRFDILFLEMASNNWLPLLSILNLFICTFSCVVSFGFPVRADTFGLSPPMCRESAGCSWDRPSASDESPDIEQVIYAGHFVSSAKPRISQ